jgi:hypothetical protein
LQSVRGLETLSLGKNREGGFVSVVIYGGHPFMWDYSSNGIELFFCV